MTTTRHLDSISRGQVALGVFGAFRRTRPFWGGLLLILAGLEIGYLAAAPIGVVLSGGWSASAGYLLGGVLVVFGVAAWWAPLYAPPVGLAGVLVALLAFVASNVGGFVLGTLLGVLGGSLTFAWGDKPATRRARRSGPRRA